MFTDSLVLAGLTYLCIIRTWRLLCRKDSKLKFPKEFKAFYILCWINLILTFLLYILSSANFTFNTEQRTLATLAFYLLPQILMVLCYALLY